MSGSNIAPVDIRIIKKIHDLIVDERTGTPGKLSERLGVSVRTVYNYISFMKNEMNAPIVYDNNKFNYCYDGPCNYKLKW